MAQGTAAPCCLADSGGAGWQLRRPAPVATKGAATAMTDSADYSGQADLLLLLLQAGTPTR